MAVGEDGHQDYTVSWKPRDAQGLNREKVVS